MAWRGRGKAPERKAWEAMHVAAAALAVVISPEHQQEVLDGDDERQRPKDEGRDPRNVIGGRGNSNIGGEIQSERIEWARADVPEDNAGGQERETEKSLVDWFRWSGSRGRARGPTFAFRRPGSREEEAFVRHLLIA